MRFQPYPSYRYSGVKWLGEVPEHWAIMRLKNFGIVQTGVAKGRRYADSVDTIMASYLRVANVQDGYLLLEDIAEIEIERGECQRYLLRAGDVLMNEGGDNDKLGRGAIWNGEIKDCIHQNHVFAVRVFGVEPEWLSLCSQGSSSKFYFFSVAKQTTNLASISSTNLKNLVVAVPPQEERSYIANFLDRETVKIDTLIEKQEQLIKLLEEKRQAVISHAVTKGLNPDVPMKDSGVEWLGEVPEHWTIKNYRYATTIFRGKFGHRPRNDPAFYDGEFPFVQTGDIARADVRIEGYKQTLNAKGKAVSEEFPSGTLVMAIAANVGDVAILNFDACCPDSVVGFKPRSNLMLEYLRYSFMSSIQGLISRATVSTQLNLNIERIGGLKAVFPTIEEQTKIVEFLDGQTQMFKSLVSKNEVAIRLLRERRTALISAAVTGKIDVREAV